MRWDKLFADLESQADEDALAERDALIEDLSEGEWAGTSWRQLCGGYVRVEAVGIGHVEGEVMSINERLLHVRAPHADTLISPASVLVVSSWSRRADPVTSVSSRLGWPAAFRLCQRDQDRVKVHRVDGTMNTGLVAQVGQDFVQIRDDADKSILIPLAAISAVSCPR
ncbi:MAG: hypothetical protein ABIR57_12080 [Aeromicrobium sp.]